MDNDFLFFLYKVFWDKYSGFHIVIFKDYNKLVTNYFKTDERANEIFKFTEEFLNRGYIVETEADNGEPAYAITPECGNLLHEKGCF